MWEYKLPDCNGFGGVKIIIIIPAIFIFRPYGTLEIIGNGVAINTHVPIGTFFRFFYRRFIMNRAKQFLKLSIKCLICIILQRYMKNISKYL